MKTKNVIVCVLTSMLFFVSCDKEDDVGAKNGTLNFLFSVWNAEHAPIMNIIAINVENNSHHHTLELINVRQFIPKIEVTTDEIRDGLSPDDIDWFTMYESSEEMLHTDRNVTIEIPVGNYTGFRITQRSLFYWVCVFEGDTIEFPAYNNPNIGPNDLLINYMGEDGLYELKDGVLMLRHPNEKLGTFEIMPNKTTRVTMRMNIISIDWHDNDGSGDWSNGDQLSNWSLPEGITTMSDFIVEYE